ncbi:hypothetical protein ACHAWF_011771 [Thalassiosira exigua]
MEADDGNYQRYDSPTELGRMRQQQGEGRGVGLGSGVAEGGGVRVGAGGAGGGGGGTAAAGASTDLHRACASPGSSLSKLRATLLALGRRAASARDEEGNLPLHLLGRNELLIHLFLNQARYDVAGAATDGGYGAYGGYGDYGSWNEAGEDWMSVGQGSAGRGAAGPGSAGVTSGGGGGGPGNVVGGSGASRAPRTELDPFVVELVRANPRAMVTPDARGRVPLTDAIYDWIEYSTRDSPGAEVLEEEGAPGGYGGSARGGGGAGGGIVGGGGPGGAAAGGGGGDRPATSNLGMGSARGGSERPYSNLGSHRGSERVEGMSELMGPSANRIGQEGESSVRTGKRSVLENVSLPSAFRSAYSSARRADADNAGQSRAAYRQSTGELGDDPAERQRNQFRNTWSAAAEPRPDGPSDEGDPPGGDGAGGASRRGGSRAGGSRGAGGGGGAPPEAPSLGRSDLVSEPPEANAMDDVFPLNLAMPPVVEWSLRMISVLLDGIEGRDGPLGADEGEAFSAWREGKNGGSGGDYDVTSGDSAWIGKSLVSSIASIPSLMKTLLLLNDADPAKSRVFHLSIVRRAISSKYTVGNWLVYMLEAIDPIVARRGVDYLEILSEDEDENALIPSTRRVRYAGTQLSPAARASLYYKVSRLDHFLPAILALEETAEVDRAAKTKLLRHILDKELGSRGTLTMAFFDLSFLLMLLVTFQITAYHVVEGGVQDAKYFATYFLSMFGVLYAILRKFGQMSSMIKISRQAFAENNFRWVDGVDWLAILLATGGIIWMEVAISGGYANVPVTNNMRSYLAAAICSVWLKLVSWLSVINWQVINLVRLFYQVVKGIRWILFFLLIAILASSQMFYVMLSGQNCDSGYCEMKNAYLQVWSILLGQFDVADYQTAFSVIAFVAFTFVTFIVFGFSLISTSIDVYNKAVTFRSENSAYGNRSRLVYIAELRAFRRLFDQRWTAMQYCAALLFLTSTVVLFLFAAVQIRDSLGEYYSGGILGGAVALLLVFLFVSITAFVSHMTYYSYVEDSGAKSGGNGICRCLASNSVMNFFARPVEQLMRFIVDIDNIHLDGTPSTSKYTDSWQGSATHVRCHVKRMLMQSEAHMSSKLRNELFLMEMRHKKAGDRSRSDVLTEIRA